MMKRTIETSVMKKVGLMVLIFLVGFGVLRLLPFAPSEWATVFGNDVLIDLPSWALVESKKESGMNIQVFETLPVAGKPEQCKIVLIAYDLSLKAYGTEWLTYLADMQKKKEDINIVTLIVEEDVVAIDYSHHITDDKGVHSFKARKRGISCNGKTYIAEFYCNGEGFLRHRDVGKRMVESISCR